MPIAFDRHLLACPSLLRGTNPPPFTLPTHPLASQESVRVHGLPCRQHGAHHMGGSQSDGTPVHRSLPLNPCLYNCTGESVDEQTSSSSARPICRFPGCVQDWHHFGRRSWRGTGDCLQSRTLVIRCASAPVPVRCLRERASDGGQHTACPLHPVLVVRGGKESCLPPPRRVDERPPA